MDTLEEDGKVREGTVEVSKGTAWEGGIEGDWIAGKDSWRYFIESSFGVYLLVKRDCKDWINFSVWIENWEFSFNFLNAGSKGFSNPLVCL